VSAPAETTDADRRTERQALGAGENTARTRPSGAILAIVATFVVTIPPLLVIANFAGRHVIQAGDGAVIDARVRDVFTRNIPLVGPYSVQWSHPGPLLFYLFAPLSLLSGHASWSTIVSGALLHIVAIAWGARLAWRRGGLGLTLLVLLTFSLTMLAARYRLLTEPWNPHVALPFYVCFVLLIWSVALGDRWQAVGVAVVGTYLVQTHIGYLPLVAAGVVAGIAIVVVDGIRARRPFAPWRAPVLVSAAVGLVLWAPPIIEQLTHDPGNLRLVARYFLDHPDATLGLRRSLWAFAQQYRPIPRWLGGNESYQPLTFVPARTSLVWMAVPAALLIGTVVVARRRRLTAPLRLAVVLGVAFLSGIVALARAKERGWDYMALWRYPTAILVVVVAVWTVRLAAGPLTCATRTGAIVVCVLALLGGTIPVARDVLAAHNVSASTDAIASILRQLDGRGIPDSPFMVERGGAGEVGVNSAIVNALDRDGAPVKVPRADAIIWGEGRAASLDEVGRVWVVAEQGIQVSRLTAEPDARVVARTTPLSPVEERELMLLQRRVADQLEAAGHPELVEWLEYADFVPLLADMVQGLDPSDLARIRRLDAKVARSPGCRCAVVEFAPDELPASLAPR
jgi:hypothetical protein